MSVRLALALVLSAIAAPAAAQQAAPPPKLTAEECAVWARELGFARALAEHDAAAFAGHLHEGAAFGVKQPQPQRGREAIALAWAPLIEGKTIRLEWYPTMVVIGGEPDIAMSTGPALYEDLRPGANPRYRLGGFQSVWKRGEDGVWRVLFDDGLRPQPADEAAAAAFRAHRREACPQG